MKTILLTRGKEALVDDEDHEHLSQWSWCAICPKGRWYAFRYEWVPNGKPKSVYMHKVLCLGNEVDHRDGNGLNNQKENLRSVSHSFNIFNSKRVGKSGIRGLFRLPNGRWRASLRFEGRLHYLGTYSVLEDAKEARRLAEIRFFGEVYEPKPA